MNIAPENRIDTRLKSEYNSPPEFNPLAIDAVASMLKSANEMRLQEVVFEPLENGGFRLRVVPKFRPLAVNDAELAKLLGVTKFLVADWAKKEVFSSFKEGNTRLFLLPVLAHDLAKLIDLGRFTEDRKALEMRILDWLLKSYEAINACDRAAV